MIFSADCRIALVAGGLPLGGSTTYMLFLASSFQELGVKTEIFSFTAGNPLSKEFSEAGIKVHLFDEQCAVYEDRLTSIYDALRNFAPTFVLSVLGAESFETLRYLPNGVGRIGIFLDRAINPAVFGPRYRPFMDHLILFAQFLKADMEQLDPTFPCTYLSPGIPIPKEAPPREANASSPIRLLYYGRFENVSKGVRLFPEIVAALKQRNIPFQWTLHGYGPEQEFLLGALAEEIKAGEVRFSEPIDYDQLPELIRQHDVYMLASTNEGGPFTLLESMALGLVPVCGEIPCLIQEVITPLNGFRVQRDDPEAYAKAIATLHKDRHLLEQMSQEARTTITSNYSSLAMGRRYLSFIQSLNIPSVRVVWPEKIKVKPIFGANPFAFTALGRAMRRAKRYWKKLSKR